MDKDKKSESNVIVESRVKKQYRKYILNTRDGNRTQPEKVKKTASQSLNQMRLKNQEQRSCAGILHSSLKPSPSLKPLQSPPSLNMHYPLFYPSNC